MFKEGNENRLIDSFYKSILQKGSERTAKEYYSIIKKITDEFGENFLDEFDNPILLEEIIARQQAKSLRQISIIMVTIKNYAQFLNNKRAVKNICMVDRNAVWDKMSDSVKTKYISYEMYEQVAFDIEMNEEYNSLFYQTLWGCLFEGMYSEDMSVLDNLRTSDIDGNMVTLRPNNKEIYTLEVSNELAQNMKLLAQENVYYRKTGSGWIEVPTRGKYEDSVFKFENRSADKRDSFKFSFYTRVRNITKKYIGFNVTPKNIFISGIMYKITKSLNENGYSISDFLESKKIGKEIESIVVNELKKVRYNTVILEFKEYVKIYSNIFIKNDRLGEKEIGK